MLVAVTACVLGRVTAGSPAFLELLCVSSSERRPRTPVPSDLRIALPSHWRATFHQGELCPSDQPVKRSLSTVADSNREFGAPEASDTIRGANAVASMSASQLAAAGGRFVAAAARHPTVIASELAAVAAENLRILAGVDTTEIDPKDRRFTDSAWEHPVWQRVAKLYLSTTSGLDRLAGSVGLDERSLGRARFVTGQISAAIAPTNTLIGNPAAMKRAVNTRGRSLRSGARHLAHDIRHNGGLPSRVDTRPFVIGENVASTTGAVIHRSELFELIQYSPTTAKVRARPLLIIPPQVNKYYFLDIGKGRSFVEHAVDSGLQTFMISWRNPTAEQRDWSIDTYLAGLIEATDVVNEVAGSKDCNAIGFCAGGITLLMLLAHLATVKDDRIHAATLGVTGVDASFDSAITPIASTRTAQRSVARSRRQGVLEGRSMASMFAWVRPNDLIWNYVANNYLMGENPPAFDVLAWNDDSTNLPAAFHADFTNLIAQNALMGAGRINALGTPVDLASIHNDLYIVGALNDHIVPWQATYALTQVASGQHRFVLSNSGHIQALINPPGNPKASFLSADSYPQSADAWMLTAAKTSGSWWTDWMEWANRRSGSLRKSRTSLGTSSHPVIEPAPGRYVRQR